MPPIARVDSDTGRVVRLALIVGVLALIVRLIYLLEFQSSVFFSVPILDAAWHADLAHRIATGRLMEGAPYFRAPLYTWFLAAIEALAGPNPWAPRIVQALLGAVSAGFVAASAEKIFPRSGLPAGLIMALYGPLVFASGELLHEALLVPVLTAWLLVTVHALSEIDDPDAGLSPWFAAALLLGFAAIIRPSALVLAPLLLLAPRLAWPTINARRRSGDFVLPILAGLVLPILPVTAINYVSSGDPVLIASQGGINFYAGNNPTADGRHVTIPELADLGGWEDFEPRIRAIAETAVGRRLGPSEVSNWWMDRGFSWIRESPGEAARLAGIKVGALLCGHEQPNNRDIESARHDSLLLSFLVGRIGPFFWPWGWLLPLALVGASLSPEVRRARLPVLAAILYGASLVPFFICDRFRLPLVPFLAVPAGIGIAAIPGLMGESLSRRARALVAAGVGIVLGAMTWGADTRVNPADSWHRLGEALYNDGRPIPALEAFHEAVRLSPEDEAIRLGRAFALLAAADSLSASSAPSQAAAMDSLAGVELLRAAERLPDAWQAQYGCGHWLAVHDRTIEAIPFLERAAGAQPRRPEVHRDLGFAYEAAGRWREAGIALNHALSLGESTADVHLSLGLAAMRGGRADLAENNWRRALELDPAQVNSLYNLGLLEAGRGRLAEAADLWRRALRVDPGNELVQVQLNRLANSAPSPGSNP